MVKCLHSKTQDDDAGSIGMGTQDMFLSSALYMYCTVRYISNWEDG